MEDSQKPTVLIVDDELMIQKLFKNMLEGMVEAEVKTVGTAQAAIEIIEKERVELVLLDLNMKEDSGFYLTDWLQNSDAYRNLPVIVVSAMSQQEIKEKLAGKHVLGSFAKVDIVGGDKMYEFKTMVKQILG